MLIELREIEEKAQGHIAVWRALLLHEDDFLLAHGEREVVAHDVEEHALEGIQTDGAPVCERCLADRVVEGEQGFLVLENCSEHRVFVIPLCCHMDSSVMLRSGRGAMSRT